MPEVEELALFGQLNQWSVCEKYLKLVKNRFQQATAITAVYIFRAYGHHLFFDQAGAKKDMIPAQGTTDGFVRTEDLIGIGFDVRRSLAAKGAQPFAGFDIVVKGIEKVFNNTAVALQIDLLVLAAFHVLEMTVP